MPLLNALEFARDHLAVSYRASPDQQTLTVHFRLEGPEVKPTNTSILALCHEIEFGMGGSDVFAPMAGRAPAPPPTFLKDGFVGPNEYRFTLEVASVAPIFLRIFVERMRAVGRDFPLASLSITGALPCDTGPMSVNERNVIGWLDDPLAYPRRWPKVSFPFDIEEGPSKGVSIQISFAGPVKKEARHEIETRLLFWRNLVVGYVSPNGEFVRQQLGPTLPRYAWKKGALGCGIERFDHTRGPSVDVLLNMLERVHAAIIPLQRVVIRI
jgi:hypothetical protein